MIEPENSSLKLSRRAFLAVAAAACIAPMDLLAAAPVQDQTRLSSGWQYYQGPLDPPFQVWHSEELVNWQAVTVPHCFNAYDGCDPDTPAYRGPGWYRMLLPVSNPYAHGRTMLHFEAAGQRAEIYIGNVLVATHSGGYDEFMVDITDFVKGSPMQIAVLCDNGRDVERMPSDLSDSHSTAVFTGLSTSSIFQPCRSGRRVQIFTGSQVNEPVSL